MDSGEREACRARTGSCLARRCILGPSLVATPVGCWVDDCGVKEGVFPHVLGAVGGEPRGGPGVSGPAWDRLGWPRETTAPAGVRLWEVSLDGRQLSFPLRPRQARVASAICGPGLSLPAGLTLCPTLALESTAILQERTAEREVGQPLRPGSHGPGSWPLGRWVRLSAANRISFSWVRTIREPTSPPPPWRPEGLAWGWPPSEVSGRSSTALGREEIQSRSTAVLNQVSTTQALSYVRGGARWGCRS